MCPVEILLLLELPISKRPILLLLISLEDILWISERSSFSTRFIVAVDTSRGGGGGGGG